MTKKKHSILEQIIKINLLRSEIRKALKSGL